MGETDYGFPDIDDVQPIPANPYWDFDEDEAEQYCWYCGNGSWKLHAPWCAWQDFKEFCEGIS